MLYGKLVCLIFGVVQYFIVLYRCVHKEKLYNQKKQMAQTSILLKKKKKVFQVNYLENLESGKLSLLATFEGDLYYSLLEPVPAVFRVFLTVSGLRSPLFGSGFFA